MEKELRFNKINREANIRIAHGCWISGVYRDNGIPRPPKEKRVPIPLPSRGTITFNK